MEYVIPDPGGYLGTVMDRSKHYIPLYLSLKNPKCKAWIPGEAELLEIGIKLDAPYLPKNSPLMIKHTDGSLEVKGVGKVYTGSIFDSEKIKTECNITLPKHLAEKTS